MQQPNLSEQGRAKRARRTQSAYEMDWRLFERWCCTQGALPLPASTATLARYLEHLAEQGRKPSTIRRARISIGVIHGEHGLGRPDCDEQIRRLEREIAERDEVGEQSATPVSLADLERMLSALGHTPRDERDRALLLLGFAGGFRSCELVGLNVTDLVHTSFGLRVLVSHEQSSGRPAHTDVRRSRATHMCPVTAIERWLERLPELQGALFRAVYGSRVTGERLAPRAVSRAVQRAAARAQLITEYSSHSLRAGLLASARARGRGVCSRASAADSGRVLSAAG